MRSHRHGLPVSLGAAIAMAALGAMLFAVTGCSDRTDTTGLPPAQADTEPGVFLDGYLPGVTFQAFLDSKYDAALIDANEAAVGTSSLAITVPGPSVDPPWFAGGAFTNEWVRDLSGYNAITFYAKSERPTTLNEVGFGISFGVNRPTVEAYSASVADIPLTTEWVQHTIAIPDPSKLNLEAGLFFFSEGHEGGAGYKFWLDEIQFEQVTGITNQRPTMRTETVSAFAGSEIVPAGTQVTCEVDGQDQLIVHAPGYFTYASNDESIVKVDADGTLTAIGNGSAMITAKLGDIPVVGSITVNSSTLPTQAAPAPTLPAASVISIFSDAYTDVTVDKWMADWAVGNLTDMDIAGDPVKAYTSLGYAAIEILTSPVNAGSMTHFHVDVWAPGGTDIIVKLVDFGADGAWGGIGDNLDTEHALTLNAGTTPPFAPGAWVPLDIPMSAFAGLAQTAHIAQIVFEGVNTVIVDNIYFNK